MLRSELIRAASNVVFALQNTGLVVLLEKLMSPRPGRDSIESLGPDVIRVFKEYSRISETFTDADQQLINIFGLEELNNG